VATERPTFKQGELSGAARRLEFQQDAEQLTLDGQVRLWDESGTKAKCQRLVYQTDTGVMQIEAPAEAELFLSEEDVTGR